MKCKSCGAQMQLVRDRDYWVCAYCISFVFPHQSPDGVRVLGEPSDLDCPVCKVRLVASSVQGYRVDSCGNCHGVLSEQHVFAGIVQTLRALRSGDRLPPRPIAAAELNRSIACPGCRHPMAVHPYFGPGNVVIDSCGTCALIWADRGELSIIGNS